MNDRAVNILEKYDIEVLRSWKGRGAILCETKTGIKILKEYKGSGQRLLIQQKLLENIKKNGYSRVEEIIPDKEGQLVVRDEDMTAYYLKEYRGGKECNSRDAKDCEKAMEELAKLHLASHLPQTAIEYGIVPFSLTGEMEKHNRELKKAQRFLKGKSQKSDFELLLSNQYDIFYDKAYRVWEKVGEMEEAGHRWETSLLFCHGDYQHHNILFMGDQVFLINFEKFGLDSPGRDISLFFRKIMEKNNWAAGLGQRMLNAYERYKPLSREEKMNLYYRLSYPEKFWKIVNFYYNSSKVWIPGKNLEKLEKLLRQEEEKNLYLEQSFLQWVLQ